MGTDRVVERCVLEDTAATVGLRFLLRPRARTPGVDADFVILLEGLVLLVCGGSLRWLSWSVLLLGPSDLDGSFAIVLCGFGVGCFTGGCCRKENRWKVWSWSRTNEPGCRTVCFSLQEPRNCSVVQPLLAEQRSAALHTLLSRWLPRCFSNADPMLQKKGGRESVDYGSIRNIITCQTLKNYFELG